MDKNKKVLTIEMLKKANSIDFFEYFIVVFFLIIFSVCIYILYYHRMNLSELGYAILVPIGFILVSIFGISFSIKSIKKEKNDNIIIDNHNFKIVEDKIYDKYMESYTDNNGNHHYSYYIFSKTYGEISTEGEIYEKAKKDDSLFLIFYNNNNVVQSFDSVIKETIRNSEVIDQHYLCSQYELSQELKMCFISYDEKLANDNFGARINEQIKKLEAKRGNVNCKICDTKYKLKKYDICPKCGSKYKFDIVDVVHEKEWYK